METAQKTILEYMDSLRNSKGISVEERLEALDAAVADCSSFVDADEWIASFVADCYQASGNGTSAREWLQKACDIILDNADTGAISGSDAGTDTTKDAIWVVPENTTKFIAPTTSSTVIDGLTVYWPETTTVDEQLMVAGLNTWWIKSSLDLIQESYGISFTDKDVFVNSITVSFANEPGVGYLAYVTAYEDDETGRARNLQLVVNTGYCKNLDPNDVNGKTNAEDNIGYIDRIIAHEMTHAVMMANVLATNEMTGFVIEGLAELTHGVDDDWRTCILDLAQDAGALSSALQLGDISSDDINIYPGGYMALRYLAKQGAQAFVDTSDIYYGAGGGRTSLQVKSRTAADIVLSSREDTIYASSVVTVNASAAAGSVVLVGNTNDNLLQGGTSASALWGGGSSRDTLQGGSGTDTFWYAAGDGEDTVTSFDSSRDVLKFYAGGFDSYKTSGDDLVFTLGGDSLTLQNKAASRVAIETGGTTFDCWFAHTSQADSVIFSTDINLYVGSAGATDTLLVTSRTDNVINLQSQQDIWYLDIDIVDATNAMGQQILIGSADRSSTLIGGTGSTAFWGGSKDDDILQGGSGKNTFWYGTGDGEDTITRSSVSDVLYIYSADFACTSAAVQDGNLVIAGQQGDSLTIKGWTETAGVNTLRLADSSEYHIYRANDGTIGTRRIK